jgi:hypothetical protein
MKIEIARYVVSYLATGMDIQKVEPAPGANDFPALSR